MTTLDALYSYAAQPTEATAIALANLREVYGIRRLQLNEAKKTVRVEYDATRLNGPTIEQLLRRTGLDIVESLSLIPPQPALEAAAPAPAK